MVHDSSMTESATVPAAGATKTAADSTNTPDAATDTGANQPLTAGDAALPAVKFGAWPSPIHAADVARGLTRISYPRVIGTEIWWQEGRPDEDGRMTVLHRGADAKSRVLLPAPWNARTRVHEYGGLSYPVSYTHLRPRLASARTSATNPACHIWLTRSAIRRSSSSLGSRRPICTAG